VCSVDTPFPPHQRVERFSTIEFNHVCPISRAERSGFAPWSSSARTKVKVPGYVVVGHDQRVAEAVMHVIFDRPELANNALVAPVLERPAQIDPD
jgi:hypothetical protein